MNDTHATVSRWAPWWAYVVPILGINYLRQVLISPADAGDVLSVALFAVITALVIVVVTAAYRLLRG